MDTHQDTHTAAVIDLAGRALGEREFPATPVGYRKLLTWLRGFGTVTVVGIEGTGAYGAGLARHLHAQGVALVEIDRPDRKMRRKAGKSDSLDAQAAARTALARACTGRPKTRDGQVEALRNLRVVRGGAVKHRAECQQRIRSLIVTAPEPLRTSLRDLDKAELIRTCAALRPDPARVSEPVHAAKLALRTLARRHQALSKEIDELDDLIAPLVAAVNPDLLACRGVGPDVAGQLLVTAGQNPAGCAQRPPSQCSAASHRYRPAPDAPSVIDSTAAATEQPTPPSTESCSAACAGIHAPAPTCNDAQPKACRGKRSSAASSAPSHESSTTSSAPRSPPPPASRQRLDDP